MIRNRETCIEDDEEIIYSTGNLDYFLTYNKSNGVVFCHGNKRTDLSNFLIPGITSRISAETGEFLLTSNVFENITHLFNIESDKTYFVLRLCDNSKLLNDELSETLFLFEDKSDCANFNSILIDISLKYKIDFLNLNKI